MNKEFQEPPYNPHVHWHLFPRYRKPVEFSNIVFEDSKYGQMFDDAEEKLVDSNTQSQIRIRLRRAIEDFR